VIPLSVVIATLELGLMVIFEASLSFIGLGVQPPTPSWGSMLSDGQQYVATAWWLALFPGLALFGLVLAVNLLGDAVRDRLDPTRKVKSRWRAPKRPGRLAVVDELEPMPKEAGPSHA
jgi:peptide/nickel transport system permease protein